MILICKDLVLENNQGFLEITSNIATIIIAIINTFLVYWIFKKSNNQSNIDREKARKLELLKSLILDHNLTHFYNFYENLENKLTKLKVADLTDSKKLEIYTLIEDEFILVRKKFTDTLLAVDKELYDSILNHSDTLQTKLSENIFDKGINLSHQPKYENCIESFVNSARTDMLRKLFQYNG